MTGAKVSQQNGVSQAPGFSLKDESGMVVTLDDLLTKFKGVVIFVYPKANTPGCTTQACGFRDVYNQISKEGFEILGLSRDKATPQKNWKVKHDLPYRLLCEGDETLKKLGCMTGSSVARSVFIINKDKKYIYKKIKTSPAESVSEAVRVITGGITSSQQQEGEVSDDEDEDSNNNNNTEEKEEGYSSDSSNDDNVAVVEGKKSGVVMKSKQSGGKRGMKDSKGQSKGAASSSSALSLVNGGQTQAQRGSGKGKQLVTKRDASSSSSNSRSNTNTESGNRRNNNDKEESLTPPTLVTTKDTEQDSDVSDEVKNKSKVLNGGKTGVRGGRGVSIPVMVKKDAKNRTKKTDLGVDTDEQEGDVAMRKVTPRGKAAPTPNNKSGRKKATPTPATNNGEVEKELDEKLSKASLLKRRARSSPPREEEEGEGNVEVGRGKKGGAVKKLKAESSKTSDSVTVAPKVSARGKINKALDGEKPSTRSGKRPTSKKNGGSAQMSKVDGEGGAKQRSVSTVASAKGRAKKN